jgi:hypothetical protein
MNPIESVRKMHPGAPDWGCSLAFPCQRQTEVHIAVSDDC